MIYLTPPALRGEGGGWGEAGQPHPPPPPPKLKSLISPLRSWDQCNFIHCCKLSILWKFEQDWTILRGVLAWSAISLYPRHLHSQYMYFGLTMYFLSNTLLNSLLQVPTLAHQVVYWLTCALLGKFWEHLNPPPVTPITGLLELIYHTNNHCYTGCNSGTYAVRFSIRQLIFWPNFRIIDQYLVLVLADLHLFLTILQQHSNSIISVLRCNAPNVLKISLFIFKTCKKLKQGFRYNRLWYIWHPQLWGGRGVGGGRQASPTPPPPKLKSLISPLRSWDQCNFIHCCKLSILWKFEQDWTILRGVLAWSAISLYPRHLHSQYMYFGLTMYFLSNTLLNSLLQVPTLAHQVVYWLTCALLGKFWEHLNPPPVIPITGLLELIYHTNNHCYTGCNSGTYAVRFSIRQLIFWPNFRIIDQYLVLVLADLHLFLTILQQYSNSIISVLRCNAPNVLKISLFILKTCKKLNKGFRYNRLWYIWHPPSERGGGGVGWRSAPPPETEILNIALEVLRPMQFHSLL